MTRSPAAPAHPPPTSPTTSPIASPTGPPAAPGATQAPVPSGTWRSTARRAAVAAIVLMAVSGLALAVISVLTAVRLGTAAWQVQAAAQHAANDANETSDAVTAQARARASARAALADLRPACRDLAVAVDTTELRPRGQVRVSVYCTVSTRGLTLLPLPAHQTLTGTGTAPITGTVFDNTVPTRRPATTRAATPAAAWARAIADQRAGRRLSWSSNRDRIGNSDER